MANYFQMKSKHPEQKLIYYVCGEQVSLVQEVTDMILSQWPDFYRAEPKDWKDVETAILMEHLEPIVVILRTYEDFSEDQKAQITAWAYLILKGELWNLRLVVITNEKNPVTSELRFRPFVEKGRYVECKELSVEGLERYAMEDYGLTKEVADILLERVSYNFVKMNNELEKLSFYVTKNITKEVIEEYVVFEPDDLLIQHLMKNDRIKALAAVRMIPQEDAGKIVQHLLHKLSFMRLFIMHDRPGLGAHKLASALGVQPWQLLEYFPIKKFWNADSLMEKLKQLVYAESMLHYGRGDLESILVRFW